MSEIELLNCPFCGGEAKLVIHEKLYTGEPEGYQVVCKNNCAGGDFNKDYAVKAWNNRNIDPLDIAEWKSILQQGDELRESIRHYANASPRDEGGCNDLWSCLHHNSEKIGALHFIGTALELVDRHRALLQRLINRSIQRTHDCRRIRER